MDLRELKIQFLNAKVVTDDIEVKFRTPDNNTYNVCVSNIINYKNDYVLMIDLVDKIKPIFNSGDKVTNKMFPEDGYTIKEVNEEEQYYSYKEINGKTYFKDQDKLTLVEIKPKFKIGDKIKHVDNPDKIYLINFVDNKNKCYRFFNFVGDKVNFKNQDKFILVNEDNSSTPVEDTSHVKSFIKFHPCIVHKDELNCNKDIYDDYTLFIQEMMCAIKIAASQGHNKLHFDIGEKDISVFQLGQDFTNAGYKVSAVIGNNKNSEINIEW